MVEWERGMGELRLKMGINMVAERGFRRPSPRGLQEKWDLLRRRRLRLGIRFWIGDRDHRGLWGICSGLRAGGLKGDIEGGLKWDRVD